MKAWGRIVLRLLFVLVGTLMMVSQAQAAESCHKINAKGIGQDQGNGVTTANINGGGLLQGTTEGLFSIGPVEAGNLVVPIAGTVKFTTHKGTLTVDVTGSFDLSTGQFHASGPVTAATGKLAGATGELTFEGIEDFSNGSFVEDVTGRICVDLAP